MRTGNSCFWASLAFACPIIGVPFYYISLLVLELHNSRRPDKVEREERELMEAKRKQYVMQGAIEREKDFEQAMQGGGTMFDAASGMGKQLDGSIYTNCRGSGRALLGLLGFIWPVHKAEQGSATTLYGHPPPMANTKAPALVELEVSFSQCSP